MIYRQVLAVFFGAILFLSAILTVIFARWSWFWAGYWSDSMVAVGVVFTVGTFVLATVAGIIALLAYLASIQPPDLYVTLHSLDWDKDHPVFVINPKAVSADGSQELIVSRELTIRIHNRSRFSARTPACRVTAQGFAGIESVRGEEGWSYMSTTAGVKDVRQWDGGANYVIHGNWSRDIHLGMSRATVWRDAAHPALLIEVVAEAFQREWQFPVQIVSPADFERRYPARLSQIPEDLRGWEGPAAQPP